MQTTGSSVHEQNSPVATLDFRDNTALIITSYLLRVVGVGVFGGFFYLVAHVIHPDAALTLKSLVTIAIDGIPAIVSIGMIVAVMVFVLWLHELIHVSVFFMHTGAPPRIGMRGSMIFASAEGYLNTRNAMIANALAPFAVISVLGLLLMFVLPVSPLAWVFIPMVANTAAAAGDFMVIS